ncbi:MAG: DUF349 domain-containing protein, partial [Bacteroidota bacterium]
ESPASPEAKAESKDSSNKEKTTEEEEAEEEDPKVDYHNLISQAQQKEEYLKIVKQMAEEADYRRFSPILRDIKPLFDELVKAEKKAAEEKFLADGGDPDSFSYKDDATTEAFYKLYYEIQKARGAQIAKLEEERENNLKQKNDILEKIRALTESEEKQESIDELKKLQEEWKSIGPVQAQHNRSLWASYNALIDLFYDRRSIYFELKELDRKKNLATKLSICEKAEKLVEMESIKDAIKELNDLHEEFKYVGPVPKGEQEALWKRFKTASDQVYEKKRAFIKQREEEKQQNLIKKQELCEKVAPYAAFQSDKMSEWNEKTKEILAIQKEWSNIRFIPREKIKDVSKQFWAPFKSFFNNKNAFIKTLDEEREQNLKQKEAICEEVESLVQSDKDERDIADA